MPLTRYQLRNEYSLADPELYRAADKDDPEALLEGVAMAGIVGVLRQLGDLAEFAAELFHDLHEEVMTTAARSHGLMARVQQLEAEVPSLEKAFLSQTNHSSFFSTGGIDWHPNLRSEQNLITRGDLPRFIMDSYEECRGPPQLFLLDKFDVAGAGSCLQRYTDPSCFKMETEATGIPVVDVQRDKRTRKMKKKGARWRNGETPEIAPGHAKLHQLFQEESIENGYSDPARLVKLKRRQLNGSAVDSKIGKSYMEKFLESPSPDHKMVCETSVIPLPLNLISDDTSETGDQILEISTVCAVKEISGHGSTSSSPNEQEVMLEPSSNLYDEIDVSTLKEHELRPDSGTKEISSNPLDVVVKRELAVDGQQQIEGSVDGYQSDDVTSEVDSYVDALNTMMSEMEADNESRPKNSMLNIAKQGTDSDEELLESEARLSDSQSIGNSSASDENSLSKKDRSSSSCSDSLSSLIENTPSDGNGAAKLLSSTESCLGEIENKPSHQLCKVVESRETEFENTPSDGDGAAKLLSSTEYCPEEILNKPSHQLCKVVESHETEFDALVGTVNLHIPEEKTPDIREDPCSSCPMNSTSSLLQSDLGEPSSISQYVGPELDETCDGKHLSISTDSDDRTYLVESTAAVADALSLVRDDAHSIVSSEIQTVSKDDNGDPYVKSDVLTQFSSGSELSADEKCCNSSLNKVLQTESADGSSSEIMSCEKNASPEKHIISIALEEVDSFPDIGLPLDCSSSNSDILEPDKLVSEANDCIITSDLNTEDLSPGVDSTLLPDSNLFLMLGAPKTGSPTEKQFSVLTHASQQVEPDSAAVDILYSDQLSNVKEFSKMVNGEEIGGSICNVDVVRNDAPLEHQSHSPDYPQQENSAISNDVVSEMYRAEDEVVAAATAVDCGEDDVCNVTCPSSDLLSSVPRSLSTSQESPSEFQETDLKEIESNEAGATACPTEPEALKEVDQLDPPSDIISSPMKDHASLQESPPRSSDSHEGAPASHAESEAHAVTDRLEVPPADLQSILNRSVSCDPSYGDVHDLSITEQTQNRYPVKNVTIAPDFSAVDDQESNSKLLCVSDFVQNGEDAVSSPCHSQPEAETPLEKSLQLHDGQLDTKYLVQDGKSSNSMELQCEQMQTPTDLVQERRSHAASECLLDQPSPSESLPPQPSGVELDQTKQVMNSLQPLLPSLLPEATQITLEEMPPMPPLPPMQWRMGKFQLASLASHTNLVEVSQTSLSPIQPFQTEDKSQISLPSSESGMLQPQNRVLPVLGGKGENLRQAFGYLVDDLDHSAPVPTAVQLPTIFNDANSRHNYLGLGDAQTQNPFFTVPAVSTERPPHDVLVQEGEMVQCPNPCSPVPPVDSTTDPGRDLVPSQEIMAQSPSDLVVGTGSDVRMMQHPSQNLEGEQGNLSATPTAPLTKEDLQHQHKLLLSEGEMAWSSDTSAQTAAPQDGKPNGNPSSKAPRPRNPLIDAVVAHDQSKLRKVTERVRPQIPQKVDERDSLLEQIRTKSFNLKPAATTRPSIQGPKTNLKVAAILEKANAIRQALAGSDEDDDADSWSDS
ncbi:Protein SCAR2 [Quillaja saponaria]|uniref:Protein SCAR n=1 Tax=Quillaja saponaria TaxID=32244 RepID=A0AAD7PNI5_QUISA|nr:Protein SCAR2 [Quillaja saponaria]